VWKIQKVFGVFETHFDKESNFAKKLTVGKEVIFLEMDKDSIFGCVPAETTISQDAK